MVRIAAYLLIGLMAGFAAALLFGTNGAALREPSPFAREDTLADRLTRVEASLAEERRERLSLETALTALERRMQSAAAGAEAGVEPALQPGPRASDEPAGPAMAEAVRGPDFRRNDPAALKERFVDAGLSAERADFIVRRTEELRLEALQARYDAVRGGSSEIGRGGRDVGRALREELGDADYEKYLTALGRPTDVRVRSVLASSPAAQAGFRDGDRIVGYAGERVYDMSELTQLTFEGDPGESVVVDIVRDGQPMQLYLPRGPLGITGGGRRFRTGR